MAAVSTANNGRTGILIITRVASGVVEVTARTVEVLQRLAEINIV